MLLKFKGHVNKFKFKKGLLHKIKGLKAVLEDEKITFKCNIIFIKMKIMYMEKLNLQINIKYIHRCVI